MPGSSIHLRADILPSLTTCRVAPLADALGSVIARLEAAGDDALSVREVGCGFVDPAEVLALTLGLGGSLELDAHLMERGAGRHPDAHRYAGGRGASDGAVTEAGEAGADQAATLHAVACSRFAKLETGVRRRLGALPEGRSRVRGAARFLAELTAGQAASGRGTRFVAAVAREQCEAYLVALTNLLDRVRGEARALRIELGPMIAGLGPRAADLEALDALLGRASALFVGQWLARIPPALGADFAQRASAAVKALPDAPELADLESWYAPNGFVDDLQRIATESLEAVIEHERQALFGLIDAALELDSSAEGAGGAASGEDLWRTRPGVGAAASRLEG